MSLFSRIFGQAGTRAALVPLYTAMVGAARDPAWYEQGGVADSVDGRFDMVAALLALTLIRIEADGREGAASSALLTEIFIEDMDGQLRQEGIGDVVVGKHLGRMMSALGGRISAYRAAFAGEEALEAALLRNLYRGQAPGGGALEFAAARLRTIHAKLAAVESGALLAGGFPA